MAIGISLHIGLNRVDPGHYQGWDGALAACEFDAKDMLAMAQKQRFRSSAMLLTKQATCDAVIEAISDAAKKAAPGDLFWLTYSGHGGQVPDTNGDEGPEDKNRMDETWVLYDRMLVDDELFQQWGKFKKGVRILVFSDSCHSGTVTRAMPSCVEGGPALRFLPIVQGRKVYRANRALYDGIQDGIQGAEGANVRATVLLISGCQDNQYSRDGNRNGLFTGTLKKVWARGTFKGHYRKFRDVIVQRMPPDQTPNFYVVGEPNSAFEQQRPLTI